MADFAKNGFLKALTHSDRRLLEPHASIVVLVHGEQLQEQNEAIEHVYFPVEGIVSLLAVMKNGAAVESAMVGKSGASGIAVGLGRPLAISRATVQAPGLALRISTAHFVKAARQSTTLVTRIGVHQETLLAQMQQTAACNGVHNAEQRLSRWLLQAQDHIADGEIVPFTQEFLSSILGVRRSTVTLIAVSLQQAGSIRYTRGRIQLLNKPALRRAACECYEVIRALSGESSIAAGARRH